MVRVLMLVCALWMAGPVTAGAQVGPPAPQFVDPVAGLTVDQAIAAAVENVPSLRAARAAIAAAEGRRVQAGLRPNPSVSAMWREQLGGMGRMNEVSIIAPLDLFRRGARISAAEAGMAVAEADAREALLRVELEVRARYGAALAAVRGVDIARELEATARKTLELLAARVEEGASPPLDRELARVELDRMSARVRLMEADAKAALVGLARAIGLGPADVLRVRASLEAVLSGAEAAALLAEAGAALPDARPDIRAAEARVREREAALEQARSEGRWDLSVSGGYMRMRSGFPFRAFDNAGTLRGIDATFHNLTIGAMVMVPLFNRNHGAVAAAAAEREAAEAEAESLRLDARAEAAQAAIALRAALDVVERYRTAIVPNAQRNLDTVAQRYQLGRGTLFDVLQARQQLLQIQEEFTGVLRKAYEAYVAAIGARGGVTR